MRNWEDQGAAKPWATAVAGVLLALLVLVACEKEPGKGGLASIQGKVWGRDINQAGVVHDSGYVGDQDVYIAYGDHTWSDADEVTAPSGDYCFSGLNKGLYRIWVYSECDSCLFNQESFSMEVEITENKETVTLPDFVVYK